MDQQAIAVATSVADRFMRSLGGAPIDGQMLFRAVMVGYLAASGVPDDEAVAIVEKAAARALVGPVAPNPLYVGVPWMVPGPVAGAPYYE